MFAEWINNMLDADKTKELAAKIIPIVEAAKINATTASKSLNCNNIL